MKLKKLLFFLMTYKRFEYWSSEGKVWSDWFEWDSNLKPELQMDDRRIFCRLKNEYKDESICTNN